jgi:hypothetical protein
MGKKHMADASNKSIARPVIAIADSALIRSFYFWMSLLIAALVVYGFSQTILQNLIHPSVPRPAILYVHAGLFFGWVAQVVTMATFLHHAPVWMNIAHRMIA